MKNNHIEIYVANLAAYNDGILNGEWFELPTPMEEIFCTIFDEDELDDKGEPQHDWAIHDYVAPFYIGETANIECLNEIAERFETLSDDEAELASELYYQSTAPSLIDAADKIEDCIFYPECMDMGDVAREIYEENGLLDQVPVSLANYIDWEGKGRDIEIQGQFFTLDGGMIVQVIG